MNNLSTTNLSSFMQLNDDVEELNTVNWEYNDDPYKDSAKGILLAQ